MEITPSDIPDVLILEAEVFDDERGSFATAVDFAALAAHGVTFEPGRWASATNHRKHTVRGMHFSTTWTEAKVVRCARGAIFDAVIDIRQSSPTFGKWVGIELAAGGPRSLYVPPGFAHGYQTLEDATEVSYLMSDPYLPQAQMGVRWNDPAVGIAWPGASASVLSPRDADLPLLADL